MILYKLLKGRIQMKNNTGITLISLMVTIIVLLILAGVSISLVTGSSGILGRAETTVNENEKMNAKEQTQLLMVEIIQKYNQKMYAEGEDLGTLKEYISEQIGSGITTASGNYFVTVDESGLVEVYTNENKNEKILSAIFDSNGNITEHTHDYVATELKDCSDKIKKAYNFKDCSPSMRRVRHRIGKLIGGFCFRRRSNLCFRNND
jgi:Na+-transporting NADH:ubiquinone oxidoreductase subunit NqrC